MTDIAKNFISAEELQAAGFDLFPSETLSNDLLSLQYKQKIIKLWLDTFSIHSRPPYPHQVKYASLMACRKNNFPIWDMGVGKSYLTCLLIHLWFGDTLANKNTKAARKGAIQIVAPRHTLKLTWLTEITRAGLGEFVQIIESESDMISSTSPIWLYSYDFLSRQSSVGKAMQTFNKSNPTSKKGFRKKGQDKYFLGRTISREVARKYPPHLLVGDEFHRLRADTERTRCFRQVSRRAKRRLGMTGTPMDGWVEHVSTVLGILYSEESRAFPFTEDSFTKRFTRVQTVNQDWATGDETKVAKERQVPGINPAQLPEFYKATRHLMHRLMIRDPEVSGQVKFPPVNLHIENLTMVQPHAEFYDRIRREQDGAIQATLEQLERKEVTSFKAMKSVLAKIGILRMASTCPWALDLDPVRNQTIPTEDTAKLIRLVEIVSQAKAEGRKTIVFTSFIPTGYRIMQTLKKAGIGAVRVYATDPKETPKLLSNNAREDRIEFFQEADVDETCVLVANLALVSEGLTLTEASVIINFDHSWRALLRSQGLSRVVRPGQLWPHVDVYELIHTGTVDQYVWSMVKAKELANKALIDRDLGDSFSTNNSNLSNLDSLELAKLILQGSDNSEPT